MTQDNMFEVAVRSKARFSFRGLISVEDLWDLSLKDLDAIFKNLNSQMKHESEESLLDKPTRESAAVALKIDIVKHIVKTKQAENAKRLKARETREKKQRIMEILASKKDETLLGKTEEELEAMLNDL